MRDTLPKPENLSALFLKLIIAVASPHIKQIFFDGERVCMIICFKRSKMILATIVVLLIIPAIMAVSKHICPEDTAKAVSTVFENQATSDKALVYLFMDRIQEQSDEFYAPYYTISPTVAYYFTSVKEVREDGANLYITFSMLPYIGPHDTIGKDEITFLINHSGEITPAGLRHLRNYPLPDNLANIARGPLPPITNY